MSLKRTQPEDEDVECLVAKIGRKTSQTSQTRLRSGIDAQPTSDARSNDSHHEGFNNHAQEVATQPKLAGFTKFLYCPRCKELLLPPIILCAQGHSYCYKCKNHSCPICKSAATGGQNFRLEMLLKQTDLPCKYSKNGCDTILKYSERNDHENKECAYKPYTCFKCLTKVQMDQIENHFEKCWSNNVSSFFEKLEVKHRLHPELTKIFEDKCKNQLTETQTSFLSLIGVRGIGVFMVRLMKKGARWLMWVSVAKCIRDAQSFRYSVEVFPSDDKYHLTYLGPVLSLIVPETNIIDKELGFVMHESVIESALNEDGAFLTNIEIYQVN